MINENETFFDDLYRQLYAAFEGSTLELRRKLEAEKKESWQDILSTIRQIAYDKIEQFKNIELANKQSEFIVDRANSDNIRLSQEFIDVYGIMTEKKFIYMKTYEEYRIQSRCEMVGHKVTGLARLYVSHYEDLYLPMAFEDYYWACFQYESGNKKESCRFLLDAFSFINSCVMQNDAHESLEYHSFKRHFDKTNQKMNSSRGGRNKLPDLEYLKECVVICTKSLPVSSNTHDNRWVTKKEFFEYILPYLCEHDKNINPYKWQYDTGEREEIIRDRLEQWSKGELKEAIDEVVIKKKR